MRKLYKAILDYKGNYQKREQTKNLYLFLFFSGKRIGEVMQLKNENIDLEDNIITSPKEITKGKPELRKPSFIPVPEELRDFFEKSKKEKPKSALVWDQLIVKSQHGIFERIQNHAELKKVYPTAKLSVHDFRRLQTIIMVRECKIDTSLADYCLDHAVNGTTQKHYLHFEYEDKAEAFKIYWAFLRREIIN